MRVSPELALLIALSICLGTATIVWIVIRLRWHVKWRDREY